MNLEKLVVTPSDTRVYLWRTAGAGRDRRRPALIVVDPAMAAPYGRSLGKGQIAFDAVPLWIQTATGVQGYADDLANPPGVVAYDVMGPSLHDYHGPWTLVVPTRGGSVTFRFTVGGAPPATTTPAPGATTPPAVTGTPLAGAAIIPSATTTPTAGAISTPVLLPVAGTPAVMPSGTPHTGGGSAPTAPGTPTGKSMIQTTTTPATTSIPLSTATSVLTPGPTATLP